MVEPIDPIVEPAAHVELLAVGRPDQARERLGEGLRAVEAGSISDSDEISLRNN